MDYRGRLLQSLASQIFAPLQSRLKKSVAASKIRASKAQERSSYKRNSSRSKGIDTPSWPSFSVWVTTLVVILGSGVFGFLSGRQYLTHGSSEILKNVKMRFVKPLSDVFGLTLRYIEITGISRLSPRNVLDIGQFSTESALPLIDIYALRQKLEAKPLVENASVRVFYPDRLVLDIVERDIHALWQHNGIVYAVDYDGRVLTSVQKSEIDPFLQSLPYIIGPEAYRYVKDYEALINHAGFLKTQISSGSFVNQRRWTLKLKNGVDVYLPEKEAPLALELLSVLEQDHHILEKDIAAIDMRLPDRVIFRLTPRAVTERARFIGYASKKRNM